jgi:ribose transport system substrate-binding protein
MKKKIIAGLIAAVMSVSLLAGCGGSSDSSTSEGSSASSASEASSGSTTEASSGSSEESSAQSVAEATDTGVIPSDETLYIGVSIRGLTNAYYNSIKEAAEDFAAWLTENGQPAEVTVLECNSSDDAQVSDATAFIAAHGQNCILYVDPNNAPVAVPIAEACEAAGVYWCTVWSSSDDLDINDYEYYVFHETLADELSGYQTATGMFEQFDTPGEGKVLAILGLEANSASINRKIGLDNALAENPGVELVEVQACDWDAQTAYNTAETWLSKYDDIDGIWCANDDMALAVCELLDSKGLAGEIKVTGVDGIPDAVTSIEEGKLTATVYSNPYLQAGLGCAYLYKAYSGQIVTTDLTAEERCFLTEGFLITPDTVDEFNSMDFTYDYSDPSIMIYEPLDLPLVANYDK